MWFSLISCLTEFVYLYFLSKAADRFIVNSFPPGNFSFRYDHNS